MKGQMVFEFVIAAVLLFGIIIYSITLLNTNVSQFRSDSYQNDLEVRAMQMSEMLVHNMGDYSNPDSILLGLASNWSNISLVDVDNLKTSCDDPNEYAKLLDNFNLLESPYMSSKSNYDFRIIVQNTTDVLVDCKDSTISDLPSNVYVSHAQRIALSE
ncbi:MAG: hypothetical protein ABIH52_04425, partial [Candidatus Aenigmatarchaeota archaeon]